MRQRLRELFCLRLALTYLESYREHWQSISQHDGIIKKKP